MKANPALLTRADILDLRAYERVRDDYRLRVIRRKRRRRVALGPLATVVFECVDTVRFQVQEMARAERIGTDAQLQAELDAYNPLLPAEGELSATLFLELTDEAALRKWLPLLVGVEESIWLEVGPAKGATRVRAWPAAEHAEALTRDEVTAAVHYLRLSLTPAQVDAAAASPLVLGVDHPDYQHQAVLSDETKAELLGDLRGETEPLALG